MIELYPTVEGYKAKIEEGFTDAELEWWILFCVAVAGKNADTTRKALDTFLFLDGKPFRSVQLAIEYGMLDWQLKYSRLGQYNRIGRAFRELARHDADWLRTVDVDGLREIHGIGPKTARFFLMSTRKDANYAAFDVHLLKWMRSLGYDAPKNTPQSEKVYRPLEEAFTEEARKRNMTNAELDYAVWLAYKNGGTYV